jgi:para-nitrobenzyl esterase
MSKIGAVHRRTILSGALSAAMTAASHRQAESQTTEMVVETSQGKLCGKPENGVQIYLGIPYAVSTSGPNRFLPPQELEPWAGIRDATSFGSSAPQGPVGPDALTFWYNEIQPISETCLTLNVFTPSASTASRKPVMVWIHGGGWSVFSGSAPGFNGSNLARMGDVVVVTVNHRLNLFGYLKLDDKDERFADSGNAGLLDLVAALRWVHDNVAAFGGDPGNVTIFGQSGGGAKVSALMATFAATGLFHRAIAQSCSGSLRHASSEEAAALANSLAGQLGLARASGEALQAISTDRLVAALVAAPRPYRPVLDGRTFTRDPFEPDAPPTASDIPLMAGNAATETRLMMAVDRGNFTLKAGEVRRRVARFLRTDAAETNRIIDAYQAADATAAPSDLLAAITTDYAYIRNTRREALHQSASARAPVFTYVFNWRTPVWDGVLRSPHELEVPFLFGNAAAGATLVGTGPDIAPLTKMMIATWSAFAYTGDPNNSSLPRWPRYDAKDRFTMVLDTASRVERDPGGQARAVLDPLPVFEYNMPQNYAKA